MLLNCARWSPKADLSKGTVVRKLKKRRKAEGFTVKRGVHNKIDGWEVKRKCVDAKSENEGYEEFRE